MFDDGSYANETTSSPPTGKTDPLPFVDDDEALFDEDVEVDVESSVNAPEEDPMEEDDEANAA